MQAWSLDAFFLIALLGVALCSCWMHAWSLDACLIVEESEIWIPYRLLSTSDGVPDNPCWFCAGSVLVPCGFRVDPFRVTFPSISQTPHFYWPCDACDTNAYFSLSCLIRS